MWKSSKVRPDNKGKYACLVENIIPPFNVKYVSLSYSEEWEIGSKYKLLLWKGAANTKTQCEGQLSFK